MSEDKIRDRWRARQRSLKSTSTSGGSSTGSSSSILAAASTQQQRPPPSRMRARHLWHRQRPPMHEAWTFGGVDRVPPCTIPPPARIRDVFHCRHSVYHHSIRGRDVQRTPRGLSSFTFGPVGCSGYGIPDVRTVASAISSSILLQQHGSEGVIIVLSISPTIHSHS